MDREISTGRPVFGRTCLVALLLTAAVWAELSWPLPRHLASAIPYGAVKSCEHSAPRFMEPGDQLQLLYHFWLFEDMARGRTPLFSNIYEFNLGNDAARREIGAYYFPFSLFFALGDAIAGRAFGWNFSGFISLWLTMLITFHLVRRYGVSSAWAWALAALTVAYPFRWINLAGGSPAGFAMCLPPLFFLGLDIALRDERWTGGFLAAIALLFSAWNDTHVFFFSLLFSPLFCLVSLSQAGKLPAFPRGWIRIALRLTPVLAALALALLTAKSMTGTVSESGRGSRPLSEVALTSPKAAGFFARYDAGVTNHIYIGCGLVALLAAGLIAAAIIALRDRRRRLAAAGLIALVAGLLVMAAMALGPHGIHGGVFFRKARDFIPHFGMIRQPAKILTIAPPLFAIAAALAIRHIAAVFSRRALATVLCAALVAVAFVEFESFNVVVLTSLATKQDAYAAVARNAREHGENPHALVIPFWPGDSHFASVYEFDASLYRIRMVNGYRPFVPLSYRSDFFHAIESVNRGEIADAQLDDLQKRGVNAIILHEDLFPEKVSPRPVTWTLKALLNHPRLTLLAHDGTVWSFRLDREAHPVTPRGTNWTLRFPTQQELTRHPPQPYDIPVGASLTLPAAEFFHAGTINLEHDSVELDPAREAVRVVLYGPRLIFPTGRYAITIDYATPDASAQTGSWTIENPDNNCIGYVEMDGTPPFRHLVTLSGTADFRLVFLYNATAPLEIKTVTLRRIQ